MCCSLSLLHCQICPSDSHGHKQFDSKVDDLNPTEDGEAGEEAHGAADEAKLGLQGHLHILLYLVIGGRVEVDLDQLQGGGLKAGGWGEFTCSVMYDIYIRNTS